MLGYSALLGLGLVFSAPWWLLRMATTRRYREGLRGRLGAVPRSLRAAVAGRRVVWMHAVSVGEVLAVSRLVGELEAALNQGVAPNAGAPWIVVVSTTTATAQALARERFGAERVFYFPLDFGWAVHAYLQTLRPAMLVLAESELWPRMLHACERMGVPVAVVNARVSDRSFRRALRVRALWTPVLRKVTLWLAQSEADEHRLMSLGVRSEHISVSGNLKYDVRAPRQSPMAERLRAIAAGRPIIVAGSTANRVGKRSLSEDEMAIQAWEGSPRCEFGAFLVLAPRHPDRFDEVFSVASEFPAVRATALAGKPDNKAEISVADHERTHSEILVLDTIGDLADVYGVADVAFVGGSMVGRGGHNPLEPAQFGVPVVMGPSFENFRDIVGKMQGANALRIVRDKKELMFAFAALLSDRESARSMGARGREVFEREQGATARSVRALLDLVQSAGGMDKGEEVPA